MNARATLLLIALAYGCSPVPASDDASVPNDAHDPTLDASPDGGTEAWTFETIETRTETVLDMPRTVELVRAHRPDGGRTYLLYVHARDGAPLVILNQPYDGIDWTGEEVDERWAALGDGAHPDVDGPGDPGSDVTSYANKPVSTAASDAAVYLLNEISVVHVYGRFYAGGSLEDDILDATAGYHFALSRAPFVDVENIGSFGGSWGGMMALFGASRAPRGVTVRAVAPISPPSDFVDMWDWTGPRGLAVYPDPAQFTAMFGPYRRRILAATGGQTPEEAPAAWAPYQPAAVCAGLTGPVLVPHDEWDVLIPVGETRALEALCPEHVAGLYWPRQGDIDYELVGLDHGPFGQEPVFPTAFTLAVLEIVRALRPSPLPALTVAHDEALESYLALLREEQMTGGDVSYATEPLMGLCDPRVRTFDPVAGTFTEGTALLASALNTVYGTTTTPANVCEAIADGLPTP